VTPGVRKYLEMEIPSICEDPYNPSVLRLRKPGEESEKNK